MDMQQFCDSHVYSLFKITQTQVLTERYCGLSLKLAGLVKTRQDDYKPSRLTALELDHDHTNMLSNVELQQISDTSYTYKAVSRGFISMKRWLISMKCLIFICLDYFTCTNSDMPCMQWHATDTGPHITV